MNCNFRIRSKNIEFKKIGLNRCDPLTTIFHEKRFIGNWMLLDANKINYN